MKTLLAVAVGAANFLATGAAYAANARITNGMQDMEDSAWIPLLFAIVVFGLVTWALSQLASEPTENREAQGELELRQKP